MKRLIIVIILAVVAGCMTGYFAGNYAFHEFPYLWEKDYQTRISKTDSQQIMIEPSKVKDSETNLEQLIPKAVVDEETFNFGVFEQTQHGQHDFIVRNEGNANLTLEFLGKSCSCTRVDISRSHIAPGKEEKVTVYWEPNIRSGAYAQAVHLKTNDPKKPQIFLNVKGVYSAPIIVVPNTVILNSYTSQKTSTTTFRFYSFEKTPIQIQEALCSDPHFEVTMVASVLTEQETKSNLFKSATSVYDGTVTMKAGLPLGYYKAKITVRSTSELLPNFEIPLEGQILSDNVIVHKNYDKQSGALRIGQTQLGTPLKTTFFVQLKLLPTDVPVMPEFKITNIKPEWLKTSVGTIIGDPQNSILVPIHVEIPENALLGMSSMINPENMAEITIESNLPEMPPIRIPLEYTVSE